MSSKIPIIKQMISMNFIRKNFQLIAANYLDFFTFDIIFIASNIISVILLLNKKLIFICWKEHNLF